MVVMHKCEARQLEEMMAARLDDTNIRHNTINLPSLDNGATTQRLNEYGVDKQNNVPETPHGLVPLTNIRHNTINLPSLDNGATTQRLNGYEVDKQNNIPESSHGLVPPS
ncbi:hypothetical protein Salat_1340800 [Sesamum alatum]|uniref:Uncharacterized protein n=1 Tax=Sesamum alatum TaxID=300844 RepID=A0AAE2CQ35_9LAMI|nr:hypothetical protein Salat_1340800 [Sesamum alatum]